MQKYHYVFNNTGVTEVKMDQLDSTYLSYSVRPGGLWDRPKVEVAKKSL